MTDMFDWIKERGRPVLLVLFALLFTFGCMGNVAADDQPPPTDVVAVEDVLSTSTPETQELAEEVTITFEDVIDQEVIAESECMNNVFLTNSTKNVVVGDRGYRQDSDSFTIPFQSDDPVEMLSELRLEENCRNIVVTDGLIKAFAESDLTIDGKTLYELNQSWMDPCLALAGSYQEYFEASALGNLVRVEVDADGKRTTYVRDEVQDQCSLFLNVLISKAQVIGIVDNLQTRENWHLPIIADQLPRAVLNEGHGTLEGRYDSNGQYRGRFLVLAFGLKGYGCVWTFGFNHGAYDEDGNFNPLGDKRFAVFACEDVPDLPPEETPPETTEPPTTETTNPPETTPTTTTPTVTTPPTTLPPVTTPPTTNPCDGPNKPSWCHPPEPTMPATTRPPATQPPAATVPVSTTPQSNTTAPPPATTPASGEETPPNATVVGP